MSSIFSHPSPSSYCDQPLHIRGEPVDLCCMNLIGNYNDSQLVIQFEDVPIRYAKMDDFGVSYVFQIYENGWHSTRLSRRNFGIDNFDLEIQITSLSKVTSSDISFSNYPVKRNSSKIKVNARVYYWGKDKEIARAALHTAWLERSNHLLDVLGRSAQ